MKITKSEQAKRKAFEAFDNHQLIEELRSRGLAVAVFAPDDIPAWADLTREEGDDWFDSKRDQLEELMVERGCEILDMLATHDDLPEHPEGCRSTW